jgi:hypothetical protein
VFQSATAKDAAELADAAAMFVVVRAKSNLAVLNGNLRKKPPASIHPAPEMDVGPFRHARLKIERDQ